MRSSMTAVAVTAALFIVGLPVVMILLLGNADAASCGQDGSAPQASSKAKSGIPANYLKLYQAAGEKYGVPWTLLAGVGSIETDHGRLKAAGVTSGANSSGAAGPMQFLFATFQDNKVDGNQDGRFDIYDPADAIPSAAVYLKKSGAPGNLHAALFAYNHAEWYVQDVLGRMRAYDAAPTADLSAPDNSAPSGDCGDLGGLATGDGNGRFSVAAGANRPGVPITSDLRDYIARMASFYDEKLVLTTGTNHDQFSASGLQSDHWLGNGGDFGMVLNGGTNDGPVGDRIAAAAFLAAGLPRTEAIRRARAGGLQAVYTDNFRVQIIWKYDGHHDHVHVGLKRI